MGEIIAMFLSAVGLVAIGYLVARGVLNGCDYFRKVNRELKRLDDRLNSHYTYIGNINGNLAEVFSQLSKLEKGKK